MNEYEKAERGVIFAATLLKVITAPFIAMTVIVIIGLFFMPFIITNQMFNSSMDMMDAFLGYGVCVLVFVLCYVFSNGMIMIADMMKANHFLTRNRQTPKLMLYDLVNNLLALLALEFIIGGIMGGCVTFALHDASQRGFNLSEVLLFLFVIIFMGITTIYIGKLIMRLSWWREL